METGAENPLLQHRAATQSPVQQVLLLLPRKLLNIIIRNMQPRLLWQGFYFILESTITYAEKLLFGLLAVIVLAAAFIGWRFYIQHQL